MAKAYNRPTPYTHPKMIDPILRREIEEKKKHIIEKHEDIFDLATPIENRHLAALDNDAIQHSLNLEYPPGLCTDKDHTQRRRNQRKLANQMQDAWMWGKKTYNEQALLLRQPLTEALLLGISGRIEPVQAGRYRNQDVRVTGSHVVCPSHERVPQAIHTYLTHAATLEPLEQALSTHFHIGYIHPFADGNGRTARILQNIILRCNHLPPVVIKTGERAVYHHTFRQAIRAYYQRIQTNNAFTEEEETFYTYLASKVNIALDDLLSSVDD